MERKVYEQMAKLDSQHWWFTARRRILDGLIERVVRPPSGARILELGAGTGHNLAMLSRFGVVEASELDPIARGIASDRLGRPVVEAALPDLSMFPEGAYDLVARTILKHHGLDPEKQVTLLQIGDSRTLYSALAAGSIDSAILGPPYDIKAELEGNNRLFDSSEIFDMPFSGLATSKKKLQQDRAEVKAIVRGLERIRRYIAANRAEAESFVKQFLNLNDKEARLSVAQMVKSFRDTGRTTDEAVVDFIETTLRSTKQKASGIKPGDIVDWSVTTEVVRELDKEKK